MKETIRKAILDAGAVAVGFAKVREVDHSFIEDYTRWIDSGNAPGMDYLKRHIPLKAHPSHVMENAATVISVAFSYAPPRWRDSSLPVIACYAYGEDYHDVIRHRLSSAVASLRATIGGDWRICVDSAPLPERYWALECGIGRKGKNGSLIVDNYGSYVFLAEILTSHPVAPDTPSDKTCARCGKCAEACPQKAILDNGMINAGRCINYLTIEHRGEWEGDELEAMSTPPARQSLYGCDICQRVCPHNRDILSTDIAEFLPSEEIMSLTSETVLAMDQEAFSRFFKKSAIKRAKLAGLRRNAANNTRNKR